MKTLYESKCGTVGLVYSRGILIGACTLRENKISYDALRHDFEIYEEDLDLTKFTKQPLKK